MAGRRVECFMIEPTGIVKQELRRYRSSKDDGGKCPGRMGYHNGIAPFRSIPVVLTEHGTVAPIAEDEQPPKDDPRWPAKCDDCEYRFIAQDEWQVFQDLLYHRAGDPAEFILRDAPVGSMWDCPWFPVESRGPDGKCLCIMTPGGEWMPDMPSTEGRPWVRTGDVPKITVRPSILIPERSWRPGGFHAFLTDGFLDEI